MYINIDLLISGISSSLKVYPVQYSVLYTNLNITFSLQIGIYVAYRVFFDKVSQLLPSFHCVKELTADEAFSHRGILVHVRHPFCLVPLSPRLDNTFMAPFLYIVVVVVVERFFVKGGLHGVLERLHPESGPGVGTQTLPGFSPLKVCVRRHLWRNGSRSRDGWIHSHTPAGNKGSGVGFGRPSSVETVQQLRLRRGETGFRPGFAGDGVDVSVLCSGVASSRGARVHVGAAPPLPPWEPLSAPPVVTVVGDGVVRAGCWSGAVAPLLATLLL